MVTKEGELGCLLLLSRNMPVQLFCHDPSNPDQQRAGLQQVARSVPEEQTGPGLWPVMYWRALAD